MSAEDIYGTKFGSAILARTEARTPAASYGMYGNYYSAHTQTSGADGVLTLAGYAIILVWYLDDELIKLSHSLRNVSDQSSSIAIVNGVLKYLGAHESVRWVVDKAAFPFPLRRPAITFAGRAITPGQRVVTLISPIDPSASSLMSYIE